MQHPRSLLVDSVVQCSIFAASVLPPCGFLAAIEAPEIIQRKGLALTTYDFIAFIAFMTFIAFMAAMVCSQAQSGKCNGKTDAWDKVAKDHGASIPAKDPTSFTKNPTTNPTDFQHIQETPSPRRVRFLIGNSCNAPLGRKLDGPLWANIANGSTCFTIGCSRNSRLIRAAS